jgi:CubicO group peptidase (beta-lactamase class C family)
MSIPLFEKLRASTNRLLGFADVLRRIPRLTVGHSLPPEERLGAVAGWLDALCSRGLFNGTVLIAQRGEILLEKHCGFADLDARVPLSHRSSFGLASVSKQFTAMGILLLARKGRLALRDRITRHIPELAHYGEITVEHLLHHTSGVPDYMELAEENWDQRDVLTMSDLIALLRRGPPPDFPPGDAFDYSNTGYALLGEIVARASGTPFQDFMAAEIFRPLGMDDSAAFYLPAKECPLQSRVFGLRRRFGRKRLDDLNYLDGIFGDGAIYASSKDLLRWDAALRAGTLMPTDIYAQAYVSGRLNDGEATGYGFGWEITPPDVVWHGGEWEGFTSYLRRDLHKHTLLVVLSNLAPSHPVDTVSAELAAFVETV